MRFATLCSGIGAPEVAAHGLGMTPVFCSDIEPFPCAVLAHHWPGVPNYGDMTAWRDWPHHDLDLLIAGTPCQAFSVAGLRQGLDDARGNLTLEFARYADAIRPRFVLWENVPGVLSDKSNAFGCLLGGLAGTDAPLLPRGGRWTNAGFVSGPKRQIAWRILDAQHFGVAQRRRRVWLCAGDVERGAGDWAFARALFPERGGLCQDFAQGGAKGKEVAGESGGGFGIHGRNSDLGGTLLVAVPMNSQNIKTLARESSFGVGKDGDPAYTLLAGCPNAVAVYENHAQVARIQSTVRRLTPRECERLQGFPDDHTAVQYRNKPACDGPRYKALGNSMAVPCVQFILENLQKIVGEKA
jgi:DNA (cytosine-5)-methyltransferase 1